VKDPFGFTGGLYGRTPKGYPPAGGVFAVRRKRASQGPLGPWRRPLPPRGKKVLQKSSTRPGAKGSENKGGG